MLQLDIDSAFRGDSGHRRSLEELNSIVEVRCRHDLPICPRVWHREIEEEETRLKIDGGSTRIDIDSRVGIPQHVLRQLPDHRWPIDSEDDEIYRAFVRLWWVEEMADPEKRRRRYASSAARDKVRKSRKKAGMSNRKIADMRVRDSQVKTADGGA